MPCKQYTISIVWPFLFLSILLPGCTVHRRYNSGYNPFYNSGYYPRYHSEYNVRNNAFYYHRAYQGFNANAGALTGAVAGIVIDHNNRWRGAVIGGSLGSILGDALTYEPYAPYPMSQYEPFYYSYTSDPLYDNSYPGYNSNYEAFVGGVTGAAVGAVIDDGNPWRGSVIGAYLGSFFGNTIYLINSGIGVPVLNP